MATVSDKTIKTYADSIKRVESLTDADFNNSSQIILAIEGSKYATSSKNLMYCALLRQNIDGLAKKAYQDAVKKYLKKRNVDADNQEPSELQKEKFVGWKSLLEVQEKAKADMILHEGDPEYYMNYLIVCLYTMTEPMRLDYNDMRVITSDRLLPKGGNLCVLKKKRGYFLFRNYKTDWKYGDLHIDIPGPLLEVIRDWVKMYNLPYLLTTTKGEPMTEANLSGRIINIFRNYTGKSVGATMIRHAWATEHHKNSPPLNETKKKSKNMGHSVRQNAQYAFVDATEES